MTTILWKILMVVKFRALQLSLRLGIGSGQLPQGNSCKTMFFSKLRISLETVFLEIFIEHKAKQTINTQKTNTNFFFSFLKRESQ